MQCQVKDLMTSQPATVSAGSTIDQVLEVLVTSQAGEVYVIDDAGRLLGVVPDYEILKARLANIPGAELVEKLMCHALATVDPNSAIETVTATFRESSRRTLAVCEAGILVGQICRFDVLRLMESTRIIEQAVEIEQAIEQPAIDADADLRSPRFRQPKQSLLSLITK